MADSQLVAMAGFVIGYGVLLMVPGPNLLAIGGIAALRGLRATLPLCVGIACGASLLSVCVCAAAAWGRSWPVLEQGARAVAIVLLLYVAARLVLMRPASRIEDRSQSLSTRDAWASFVAGMATAATNPMTAAFFASQFLVTLPEGMSRWTALGAVPCMALSVGLALAFLLSRPVAQRVALRCHRPIRIASAAVIATAATLAALSLLESEPDLREAAVAAIVHLR